ncbi:family 78 glycoside hydrolase catalytic domain [Halanaerobium sp. ST460_2HS_T2]|uniref:family 78 glycoside hydrolase catalytic domain n=1 Tax=Halanaerobium sp. ST460_2HS_T2 TaxID=2183914 RepID=UPI000DF32E44|nr:family 78 glycoside hydrolase catalytic domain [Halanaerobium sp. ST460_2HS_T2]RCW62459.1 alpha-L-rhamnosidase [Halanaerobium sp. ST460_2HS_T2]
MEKNKLDIYDLKVEYRKNPLGIDNLNPRISWKLKGNERGIKQSAYKIQVALDENFSNIVWDTSFVKSEQSVHVKYDGPELKSKTRYYYRVQIKDQKGSKSDWSNTAYWEMGLVNKNEWEAEWITSDYKNQNEKLQSCPIFRKDFTVNDNIKKARIYISSFGLYELSLNGKRVGDYYFTPGWTTYDQRLQYQTYDVTDLLKEGDNALGVILGDGWYKGDLMWNDKRGFYGDQTAVIMQLHIIYQDGRKELLKTDQSWKSTAGPIIMSDIYQGEIYDAREEISGWNQPAFNAEDWSEVKILDQDKEILLAQENEAVKKIEKIKPEKIFTTPAGETVIDMGQNMVGWIHFKVEGKAGDKVILKHAEVLDQDDNFYTGNLRGAEQKIEYILKGDGQESFEPHFTFQGFRYIKLEVYPGEVDLSDFTGVVLHSDMERTGEFSCSNSMINQLFENIIWGQKGNFLDIPTDCPQRDERLGWTGDAQVFVQTASYNMNTALFFTKWLRDLKCEQIDNGSIPAVIPDPEVNISAEERIIPVEIEHTSAAWGDAAVIVPWTIYLTYGDEQILKEQYESMKAYIEYIRNQGENEYLWNTGFHFGDWLALDSKENSYKGATSDDFVATAYYAYSTSLFLKIAEILGYKEDVREYSDLLKKIKENFRKEFVTPNGRLSEPTQTAHVLALYFDLVKEENRKRIIDTLAEYVDQRDGHLTTGFVGTPYLCHALSSNGYPELAYKLLEREEYPSWLYPVTKGATTIWEHWDSIKEDGSFWPDAMNSFNHYAYGAIGDWLYQVVGGINTNEEEPGFKKIIIDPKPGGSLKSARVRHESMYGKIISEWKLIDNRMKMEIEVPPNTTAVVILPDALVDTVRENDILLKNNTHNIEGIYNYKDIDEGVELEVGSGKYCFDFKLDTPA